MKEFKRKDALFITIIALACLIMTIANPESYDIRDLAWNYALMLLLFSAIFWFLSELGDYLSSVAFRYDMQGFDSHGRRTAANLDGLSRKQLMALANDCVDGNTDLSKLSDEELARLIMAKNGVKIETKKSKFSLIIRFYKIIKFVYLSSLIVAIKVYSYIKELPKMLKKKKKKSKKKTLLELIAERDKLINELT